MSNPKETEMTESEKVRIEIRDKEDASNNNVNVYDRIIWDWVGCIRGNETTQGAAERKRQIEKVPLLLLKGEKGGRNRENYEPMMVSLGPYHHNRDHLAAAERYKLITLEQYRLSCCGGNIPMRSLYNKVLEVVHDARKCYIDGSTDEYNDEEFNRMMLHDGCFVVFFIECVARMDKRVLLNYEYLGALWCPNVARDIFLLENQIPFVVLQVLLDLRFEDRGEEILNKFFYYLNYGELATREQKVLDHYKKQQQPPLHLLELYRSSFISLPSSLALDSSVNNSGKRRTMVYDDWNYVKRNRSFVSVMKLKANWIFVKCCSDKSSNEDLKFHSRWCYGEFELVRRAVSSISKVIYMNMIAYEMCPHNPNDFRVSTYIKVMKLLVIRPDDVEELRHNKILLHSLARDEEVVKLYDEIDVPPVNLYMFNQLRRHIERHSNNKYKTWVAELISMYFTSPWKTLALLVATVVLLTTILQTYFTIRPLPHSGGD